MWRLSSLALALALGGCAGLAPAPRADLVAFDRGAFALAYADLAARIRADCARTPGLKSCAGFDALDDAVRRAIVAAPSTTQAGGASPLDALLPLLMKLGAAGL